MATSTLVLTYTAGSAGSVDDDVTSLTVGGTAYGSLTAADVVAAITLMEGALKRLRADAANGVNLSAAARAQILSGVRSLSLK